MKIAALISLAVCVAVATCDTVSVDQHSAYAYDELIRGPKLYAYKDGYSQDLGALSDVSYELPLYEQSDIIHAPSSVLKGYGAVVSPHHGQSSVEQYSAGYAEVGHHGDLHHTDEHVEEPSTYSEPIPGHSVDDHHDVVSHDTLDYEHGSIAPQHQTVGAHVDSHIEGHSLGSHGKDVYGKEVYGKEVYGKEIYGKEAYGHADVVDEKLVGEAYSKPETSVHAKHVETEVYDHKPGQSAHEHREHGGGYKPYHYDGPVRSAFEYLKAYKQSHPSVYHHGYEGGKSHSQGYDHQYKKPHYQPAGYSSGHSAGYDSHSSHAGGYAAPHHSPYGDHHHHDAPHGGHSHQNHGGYRSYSTPSYQYTPVYHTSHSQYEQQQQHSQLH